MMLERVQTITTAIAHLHHSPAPLSPDPNGPASVPSVLIACLTPSGEENNRQAGTSRLGGAGTLSFRRAVRTGCASGPEAMHGCATVRPRYVMHGPGSPIVAVGQDVRAARCARHLERSAILSMGKLA